MNFIVRNFKQIGVLFTFFVLAFAVQSLFAQVHPDHNHGHPVLSAIQQQADSGQISKEEALLQSIYAGFKPERLDSRFRAKSGRELPIRCLTPVLIEYKHSKNELSPAAVSEIEDIITPKILASTQSHISPSGNFILYYETEGRDAVPLDDLDSNDIPDYVEKAAFAADSSYRYEVNELGFRDFLRSEPYEIYFENSQFYGRTYETVPTTYIGIHNNFDEFPSNTHPEGHQTGALYATMAHEIKHAIQYATNRWDGEAGDIPWIEMDATLMEEVVFDDVNDYYNYIKEDLDESEPHNDSIFGNPDNPIPGSYYHVSWMLYFAEMHGMQFWVDVWEQFVEERELPFLEAMDRVFAQNSLTFPQEHLINHLWHMTGGPNFTTPDFGFNERSEYPNSQFAGTLYQTPDSLTNVFLSARAANYIEVIPSNITPGQPTILLDSATEGVGIGVVGFFRNGEIDVQFTVDPASTNQSLQTIWSWNDLTDMRIAVVNTNRDSSATYTLTVTSTIPDEDTITQNYPNPFQSTTHIRFSLNETKDVKVEVFDRIGRKISTLVDERLTRGFHTIPFNGSGLASGVYFYRIVTDQSVSTKKMVLIK